MYTFALIWAWLAALAVCAAAWPTATRNAIIAIGCWLLIIGCATQDPRDVEYRRAVDAHNWALCEQAYIRNSIPTVHNNHSHGKPMSPAMAAVAVRDDLAIHRCRQVLGHYWSEY